jgi:hypothetical protein
MMERSHIINISSGFWLIELRAANWRPPGVQGRAAYQLSTLPLQSKDTQRVDNLHRSALEKMLRSTVSRTARTTLPRASVVPRAFASSPTAVAAAEGEAKRGKFFGPLEIRDGVAIIRLDGPGKMNTLGDEIMEEAEAMWVEHIENNPDVKAAVFISSKPDNFIAGADIQVLGI